MRLPVLMLTTGLLAACVQQPDDGRMPLPEMAQSSTIPSGASETPQNLTSERRMDDTDRTKCESEGGKIARVGMLQSEVCIKRYADAGKTCNDSDQCEGRCLAVVGSLPSPGKPLVGKCEADNNGFGCVSEIRSGKDVFGICTD